MKKLILLLLVLAVPVGAQYIDIVYDDITEHKVGWCFLYNNSGYNCEFNPNQEIQEAICHDVGEEVLCIGIKNI